MLKVLGDGELTKKLKISAHRFSQSALTKIQEAGGEAIVLPGKAPVVKGERRTKKKTTARPHGAASSLGSTPVSQAGRL